MRLPLWLTALFGLRDRLLHARVCIFPQPCNRASWIAPLKRKRLAPSSRALSFSVVPSPPRVGDVPRCHGGPRLLIRRGYPRREGQGAALHRPHRGTRGRGGECRQCHQCRTAATLCASTVLLLLPSIAVSAHNTQLNEAPPRSAAPAISRHPASSLLPLPPTAPLSPRRASSAPPPRATKRATRRRTACRQTPSPPPSPPRCCT
jgi:hypothetical protein